MSLGAPARPPPALRIRYRGTVLLFLAMLACGSDPAPAPPAQPAPTAAPTAPPTAQPTPTAAPDGPPPGRIGGEPILADPVVLGGIAPDAVAAGLAARQAQILACWETARAQAPDLRGKVLVRFSIGKDGAVGSTRVQSTSLRDDAAEACILDQVGQAVFPALEVGEKALVTWPFEFPPTS